MTPARRLPLLALAVLATGLVPPRAAFGQVKYPPRAETLDVQIRYRIRAERDERVRQFRVLAAHLKGLGFVAPPREDEDLDVLDPTAERFVGTIPSAGVLSALDDPRVQTILFAPKGYAYPDDPEKPVPVRVALATGFLPSDQRKFHRQAVAQLDRLGFREALGYDHRGFTLARGSLPAGNVARLLKDLRREPAGWFLPEGVAEAPPAPLRDVLPVRWVEVLPEAEFAPLAEPAVPASFARFAPVLRAVMADEAARGKPIRVEAVMDRPAEELTDDFRTRFRALFLGAAVEGAVGTTLALSFPKAADLDRFAFEPGVTSIRLPRAATETVGTAAAKDASVPAALAATRLDRLHALGHRGKGVRVVVIGSGFPGVEGLVGSELPKGTRVIDLTAELTPAIRPAPLDPAAPLGATAAARAAAAAAPDAELVLVRVSRDAHFQPAAVARFVTGDGRYTEAMQSRLAEFSLRSEDATRLKAAATDEYLRAFRDLSDEDAPRQRRERARKGLQDLLDEERAVAGAVERFTALQAALKSLAGGTTVVVNTLVWESGYPVDGLSELAQAINLRYAGDAIAPIPTRSATRRAAPNAPLWVQAASRSAGAAWGGPYHDADADAVMEFAPASVGLPAGTWTRELNFLGLRGADGTTPQNLPAGVRLRLAVQWREPHNPDATIGPDAVFPLNLRVLRQLDPEGTRRATDEFDEVARSAGVPVRLRTEPTYGIYEQTVEVVLPADGRYAVRVEGGTGYESPLPALRQQIEVRPRLIAEFVNATPDKGRPLFTTFTPPTAGVGVPGDAKSALTVDAARPPGDTGPRLFGGGPGVALLAKPDLYAPGAVPAGDGTAEGPGVAAGFVAGLSATLIESGAPSVDILRSLAVAPGGLAIVPDTWLKYVRPLPSRPRSP